MGQATVGQAVKAEEHPASVEEVCEEGGGGMPSCALIKRESHTLWPAGCRTKTGCPLGPCHVL